MQAAMKIACRRIFIALNIHVKNFFFKSEVNKLSFLSWKLEKEKQFMLKASREKIIKFKEDINETENKKATETINIIKVAP